MWKQDRECLKRYKLLWPPKRRCFSIKINSTHVDLFQGGHPRPSTTLVKTHFSMEFRWDPVHYYSYLMYIHVWKMRKSCIPVYAYRSNGKWGTTLWFASHFVTCLQHQSLPLHPQHLINLMFYSVRNFIIFKKILYKWKFLSEFPDLTMDPIKNPLNLHVRIHIHFIWKRVLGYAQTNPGKLQL